MNGEDDTYDVETLVRPPDIVNALIEIPKGSRNKFEYDSRLRRFKLDRFLYSSSHYPGDYGFLPRTLADDGDALDILVMVNEPTFTGCLIESRVIGMFQMRDGSKNDDKILAVPDADPLFAEYADVNDAPPHFLREVEHFFLTYKQLEGATVDPRGWVPKAHAVREIRHSIERYASQHR